MKRSELIRMTIRIGCQPCIELPDSDNEPRSDWRQHARCVLREIGEHILDEDRVHADNNGILWVNLRDLENKDRCGVLGALVKGLVAAGYGVNVIEEPERAA